MKILITTDWSEQAVNGVAASVKNLSRGLRQAGHEVKVLTLSGDHHSRMEGNTYYVGSMSAGAVYPNARLKRLLPHDWVDELLEWKPDIVHSQCILCTFPLAKEIASACNVPLVNTYHTVYEDFTHYICPSRTVGRELVRLYTKAILMNTQAVVAPTEKIRELLYGYGVDRPIYVIPSAIDTQRYAQVDPALRYKLRADLGIRPDECILMYAGRLAKEKNIDELFRFLHNCPAGQRLLLVGGGPDQPRLEHLAQELGIQDRLVFTGLIPPQQMPDYYQAGDIFVSASTSETQGLTYMEAMASARPLLCRADECLEGVVENGVNGFVYHDEQEFWQYMAKLTTDAALRQRLGAAARQDVECRYSIPAFAAACLNVYRSLLPACAETTA